MHASCMQAIALAAHPTTCIINIKLTGFLAADAAQPMPKEAQKAKDNYSAASHLRNFGGGAPGSFCSHAPGQGLPQGIPLGHFEQIMT